jgi:hypothetical protein
MDSAILANEALKLPALERAQIIDALWRSLDPAEQDSVDMAWLLNRKIVWLHSTPVNSPPSTAKKLYGPLKTN